MVSTKKTSPAMLVWFKAKTFQSPIISILIYWCGLTKSYFDHRHYQFLWKLYREYDKSPSCNLVQYQGKLKIQPWKNGKNPNLRPNLGPQKFFSWVLPLLVVIQCSKLSSSMLSNNLSNANWVQVMQLFLLNNKMPDSCQVTLPLNLF